MAVVDARHGVRQLDDLLYRAVGAGPHTKGELAPFAGVVWSRISGRDGGVGMHGRAGHDALRHSCAAPEGSRSLPVDSVCRHDSVWGISGLRDLLAEAAGVSSTADVHCDLPANGCGDWAVRFLVRPQSLLRRAGSFSSAGDVTRPSGGWQSTQNLLLRAAADDHCAEPGDLCVAGKPDVVARHYCSDYEVVKSPRPSKIGLDGAPSYGHTGEGGTLSRQPAGTPALPLT